MTTRSAASQYRENFFYSEGLIARLEDALSAHAKKQAADPRNYGYVGDLGTLNELLLRAVELAEGEIQSDD